MICKNAVLTIILLSILTYGDTIPEQSNLQGLKTVSGISALGAEFIGIPYLDKMINWKSDFKWQNPFKDIRESEPYLQDKLWHFVGASSSTELNYHIFNSLFNVKYPSIYAALSTYLFWTGMECMDGMGGSGFSIRDQLGNTLGVLFGVLKIHYPDIPLLARLNVRDYTKFTNIVRRGADGIEDFRKDKYSFMQAELIYMSQHSFYGGIALSTNKESVYKDIYGITVGYDIIHRISSSQDASWKLPLAYFSRHFGCIISFTYWIK